MEEHKYKDINYVLKTSNRKTISIYLERDSSILIIAPKEITIPEVEKVIESKRPWIYKSQAELEVLNKNKVKRDVVNGESFLYLGKHYKLKITDSINKPLHFQQGNFFIHHKHTKKAKEHFISFYKDKGIKHIKNRVDYFKDKLDVEPENIKIMDLQNRWASRKNKNLHFHWKTLMAPLKVIDYIIIHELSHFIIPNHSKEFWQVVESILPDYLERENWLKTYGASLDI
ncbi:MAG: M48 family metallopeptidase [Nanoarchaeota archaeon]|nr:M48 family metallopeptidase [Nanoarchaeota archaeon]